MTALPMVITADQLRPGDVWLGGHSNPDTLVLTVEAAEPLDDGTPMVRFSGLHGTRRRPLTWRFRADQRMEVQRP